jgi:hypothetical protein
MRKLALLGLVIVLMIWLATSAQEAKREGQRKPAPPAEMSQPTKPQWEYKAMTRSDVARLAPKAAGDKARVDEPVPGWPMSPDSLSQGLNILGDQGWELVAIEPHFQLGHMDATYHFGPTYILRRKK